MPADISVAQLVAAPLSVVWDDLASIDRHVEWMFDAAKITFHSEQRTGVGTTFDCLTAVGPLRTVDKMEITSWVEQQSIGVRHSGLVTGEGVISLRAVDEQHTEIRWTEQLSFPWYFGGPVGSTVAKPVMRTIWQSSLKAFAARF